MMIQSLVRKRTIALAGVIALCPAGAFAKTAGSVAVERIETRGSGAQREVVIHTSKEATFSVFRLSDPFRVLVDVNDAKVAGVRELEKLNDGVIRYVSTNTFADETSAIVRVEVALEATAEYRVRADGRSIVVTIDGPAGLGAKPAPVGLEVERRESAPAAEQESAIKLGAVTKKKAKGQTVLSARLES